MMIFNDNDLKNLIKIEVNKKIQKQLIPIIKSVCKREMRNLEEIIKPMCEKIVKEYLKDNLEDSIDMTVLNKLMMQRVCSLFAS